MKSHKKQDGCEKPNSPLTDKGEYSHKIEANTPKTPPQISPNDSGGGDVLSDRSDDSDDSSNCSSDSSTDQGRGPTRKKDDRVSSWAESVVSYVKPEYVDDDSPSRLEWLRRKREEKARNPFLDQLMSMVGLEEVKAHFLAVKDRVQARVPASKQPTGVVQPELRLHLVLQGNNGTGKKSIAKLYAQFLYSIGAVENRVTGRLSRQELFNPECSDYWGYPQDAKPGSFPEHYMGAQRPTPPPGFDPLPPPDAPKPRNPTVVLYSSCDGGPDYDGGMDILDPPTPLPRYGKRNGEIGEATTSPEIQKLMEIAEKSVLIISSRKKSFLELIEGSEKALQELPTPLILSDYNNDELRRILVRMMQKKGLSVEGGFEDRSLDVLVQRVSRERKSKSFSNVHRLQEEVDKACRRRALRMQREYSRGSGGNSGGLYQASRPLDRMDQRHAEVGGPKASEATDMADDQKKILRSEDIMGPQPKDVRHDNASWEKLQNMIGLEKVKAECGDIIDYAQINHRRQLLGIEPLKIGLNRIFLGPPGVGKTTVAQLYGQILIDLGLVSGNKVVLRNPSDLIGAYI